MMGFISLRGSSTWTLIDWPTIEGETLLTAMTLSMSTSVLVRCVNGILIFLNQHCSILRSLMSTLSPQAQEPQPL